MKRERQRVPRPKSRASERESEASGPAPDTTTATGPASAPAGTVSHDFGRLPMESGREVEPAARAAIGAAARAPGHPLPGDTRRGMEHAFGSDLTAVRIHLGGEAATAASEVGARAFTVGDQIYFGEGQFDPQSATGKQLLAHEVAHVVQGGAQRSGGRDRLELSSPEDGAEREARDAAHAVVRGDRVSVRAPGGSDRATVHRELGLTVKAAPSQKWNPAEALQEQAESTEQLDKELGLEVSAGANQQVVTATNVKDQQSAEGEMAKIRDAEPTMVEAIGAWVTNAKQHMLTDNHNALNVLGEYLAASGIQSTSMGNFQQQYVKLMHDYDRLDVMASMMDVGGKQSGAEVGAAIVGTQKITEKDRAKVTADLDDPDKAASGVLATKRSELRDWQKEMAGSSTKMKVHELAMTQRSYEFQAQVNNIAAGLPTREKPKEVQELNDLKEKLEKIKGYAKLLVGGATKALGGYLGTAAGAVAGAALSGAGVGEEKSEAWGGKAGKLVEDKAPDLANDFISEIATLPWHSDLGEAEAKAKAALKDQEYNASRQQMNELDAKKLGLQGAIVEYLRTATMLQHSKVQVRRLTVELGRVADKSGGGKEHKWETLGTFLGEADAYLAQSTAAMDVGKNEQEQAARGLERRREVTGTEQKEGILWWSAYRKKRVSNDNMYWAVEKHTVGLPSGRGSARGAGRDAGSDVVIEGELKRLADIHTWVTQIRDRIAAEFAGGIKAP